MAAIKRLKNAEVALAISPKTLLALSIASIIYKKKIIYYAFELSVPSENNSRSAYAQYILRYLPIKIFTTGVHRARFFKRIYKPKETVRTVSCGALGISKSSPNNKRHRIEELVVDEIGNRPKLIVVANGGLNEINLFGNLLDANFSLEDDVAVAMFGPISDYWKSRINRLRERNRPYYYFGEIEGNRYDLIRFMSGCDLGWALKSNSKKDKFNDRTYTPNKLFDYAASGMLSVVSKQKSLHEYVRAGIAVEVRDESIQEVRRLIDALKKEDIKRERNK